MKFQPLFAFIVGLNVAQWLEHKYVPLHPHALAALTILVASAYVTGRGYYLLGLRFNAWLDQSIHERPAAAYAFLFLAIMLAFWTLQLLMDPRNPMMSATVCAIFAGVGLGLLAVVRRRERL